MKLSIRTLGLILSLAAATPAMALAQPLVFSPVTVIDVREGVARPDMTVVVTGNRITRVGRTGSVEVPAGSTVVDATGKYLMPGLWDMHAHIVSDDWVLPLLRVNGITGLRSMHGGERIHVIEEKRQDGNYLGFEFSYSSPILDGPPGLWPGSLIAATPEQGRAAVRRLHAARYDFVKVYSNLSRETYFAIADEAAELGYPFAGHVPWPVSVPEAMAAGQDSIEHMVGLGFLVRRPDELQRMIRDRDAAIASPNGQIDLFKWFDYVLRHHDATRLPLLLDLVGGSGTWFCPTLVNLRASAYSNDSAFADDPRLKYVPEEELAIWQAPLESGEFPQEFMSRNERHFELSRQYYRKVSSLLKPMVDAGAKFLAGTDIGNPYLYPGFSLHDELALFVEAGFTPLEALRTATLNPALYLGRVADLGSVEEQKIANLVLLDANPLEDISNTQRIRSVVANGRHLDRQALDMLLTQAEAAAAPDDDRNRVQQCHYSNTSMEQYTSSSASSARHSCSVRHPVSVLVR